MIIKSISIENFRQYKKPVIFDFATDKDKKVTVIIGDNTCGKTTLVQAFVWCLYGHHDFKDPCLLNAEEYTKLGRSKEGSVKKCQVMVDIEHNDNSFSILRSRKYKVDKRSNIGTEDTFVIYEKTKDKLIPVDSKNNDKIINDILPENLSEYFFFWGEKIEKLGQKKELEAAVKQFLGLDTMNAAIVHLKKAINKLAKESVVSGGNSEIQKAQSEILRLENEIKTKETELEEAKINQDYYATKSNELYQELMTAENKDTEAKLKELDSKKKQLETLEKKYSQAKTDFMKTFNDVSNYPHFYAQEAEKRAVDLLKNNPEPVIGWQYIDLNSINEIISRKVCICGNEFCEGDKTHKYLLEQRKIVAPNVLGGVINAFTIQVENNQSLNEGYGNLVHMYYKTLEELRDDMNSLEYDISMLKKYLSTKKDVRQKEKKYNEALEKKQEFARRIGAISTKIETDKTEIKKKQDKIFKLMKMEEKYQRRLLELEYAKEVTALFEKDYSQNEKTIKEKLETHVNDIFQKIYSGDRKIVIDEKYNAIPMNCVEGVWISSEPSPGLETVRNFSFILGLVQCAKDKIIGGDGNVSQANPNSYPLVLDAPFSQADHKHIPAICKMISAKAEQIILVVMEKDWNYAKDTLENNIGKSYYLEKKSETETVVKEVTV